MLRIALCDDEQEQRELTGALLADYLAQRPELSCEVAAFPSAAALLTRVEQSGGFDLYLLDVLMPGENGIELGLALRRRDDSAVIIYLTSSPDYAVDSYLTRAFHYLLKPLRDSTLFPVLDEAVTGLARARDTSVAIRARDGMRRVSLGSVVSAELADKSVHYRLSDGTTLESINIRGAFRDAVAPLLSSPQFVLCSASHAVNLACVERVDREGVHLKPGGTLPLTRSFREAVMDRWTQFCLGGPPPC